MELSAIESLGWITANQKRWIQNDSTIINIGFKHLHGHLQVEHPAYVTAYGAPRQGALCADAEHSAGSGRAQHCRVHGFSVMPIITKSATAKCLTFKNHQKPAILSDPFQIYFSMGLKCDDRCDPVWTSPQAFAAQCETRAPWVEALTLADEAR